MNAFDPEPCLVATRRWMTRAVLGLDLCPFAAAPWAAGTVHLVATPAQTPEELLQALQLELQALAGAPSSERETTLLIHPHTLTDFLEYNEFLDLADLLLIDLELDGIVQVASFHPDYQFGDAAPDDVSNCTNRSPYPTLHLLREASVTRAVEATDTESIFRRNIDTLQALGWPGWERLWSEQ